MATQGALSPTRHSPQSLQRTASIALTRGLEAAAGAAAEASSAVDLLFVEPRARNGQAAVPTGAAGQPVPPGQPGAGVPPLQSQLAANGMKELPVPTWVRRVNAFIAEHALTPEQRVLRDKLTWMLGLANVMLATHLLHHPQSFLRYFELLSVGLLGSRWFVYRLKSWHYYMAEFCYACIGLGVVHTFLLPWNPVLYKLTIALFMGVLTPAVIATRNAFVLHSVDKVTSLFQHLIPALVAWQLRWCMPTIVPGYERLAAAHPQQLAAMQGAGFVDLTLVPMGVWLAWAFVYYVGVFILADARVRERGYATMFTLQTRNPKAGVTKFISSFKTRRMQYVAYLGVHGACTLIGCLLNNLWWHSRVAHTVLVLLVLLASMWNGACYQFDVFAKKYQTSLISPDSHED